MTIRAPRLSFGIRARASVGFGLVGLLVSLLLAGVTYRLAQGYLLEQRQDTAVRQTYVNARLARSVLRLPDPEVPALLAGLGGGTASTSVIRVAGDTFSSSVAEGIDAVPADLARVATGGRAGRQRYRDADGRLHLAIGVPMAAVGGTYFELFSLADLEESLSLLSRALIIGAAGATIAAAAVGRAIANRLVRPLRPVSDAAERIAGGALDTRLEGEPDPDLRRLIEAFNGMAASLEARIEREARFAADVSHELRSPLAALTTALEVIERRRAELPDHVATAVDVLRAKVATFQQLVLDLLEISRMDAGTATLSLDQVDIRHFVGRLLELHGVEGIPVRISDDVPAFVPADRRRLAQALGNIIDNAGRYAGGITRIDLDVVADAGRTPDDAPTNADRAVLRIVVADGGPGVPSHEREAIFGRFARGEAGMRAGAGVGAGLGLALTAEHVAMHGGQVWVEDEPEGGARFIVELPGGDR